MWKSFSHITRRLSLFSPHLSPSSTAPSSSLVRSFHFKPSKGKKIVWWDFDSCRFPSGYNTNNVAPAVTEALKFYGIEGPVEIKTFGNLRSHERFDENNIPYSEGPYDDLPVDRVKRDRARKVMFWEVLKWAELNPPPAYLFFICGGSYFADLLHELRLREYNIFLASDYAPFELRSAAHIMWRWNTLSRMILCWGIRSPTLNLVGGKCLKKRPFSWGPSPTWHVLVNIGQMMQSHTEAISVDHLFSELGKLDWKFDKKYYDLEIFTEFLKSFSSPLQIEFTDDGVRSSLQSREPLSGGGQ